MKIYTEMLLWPSMLCWMSGNSSGFFFAEKQQQQIQQNTLDPLGPNSDENKPFCTSSLLVQTFKWWE